MLRSSPKNFQKLFFDMDSFFATVEQQVQPTLRGIPVGVAPFIGNTGCIIAASKEAKKLGIKTGFLVKDAKKIYPKIKIIESRPALYSLYHKEIKKIISRITPFYEVLSIDEFLIKLSPREQNQKTAQKIAKEIKEKIKTEVGDYLTCSVGVSSNKFLAKMAGESRKPDGATILEIKKIPEFYKSLKSLQDITGISWRMEENLKKIGINSPISFYKASLPFLKTHLKHWGRLWYFRLRGYEVDDYFTSSKSISHSHVLAPIFRNKHGAEAVIRKLNLKIGYRLRKKGFSARGVSVFISFWNKKNFKKNITVPEFSDNFSLTNHVFNILKSCNWQAQPRLVYVSVFNLVQSANRQINLFEKYDKINQASKIIDIFSEKYNFDSLFPASLLGFTDVAPDRISFGNPNYEIKH